MDIYENNARRASPVIGVNLGAENLQILSIYMVATKYAMWRQSMLFPKGYFKV